MIIDKTIKSANFIKLHSPNYYILTNNIIDSQFRAEDARNVLNVKYPRLGAQVDDKEWVRVLALYNLLHSVRMIKFKVREEECEECEKCPHLKVDEEDNLCHDCYHKTCEKGECYCGC